MKPSASSIFKALLCSFVATIAIPLFASAQDTTSVIRINIGMPRGLKKVDSSQLAPTLQKKAHKLAVKYGYKTNKDWDDKIRYWSDGSRTNAVVFINASYECTAVIFDQNGKWMQTTVYLNPEFNETNKIIATLEDKGYHAQDLNSPIGPILKYHTTHDTWYEAEAHEGYDQQPVVVVVLDKKYQFLGVRK